MWKTVSNWSETKHGLLFVLGLCAIIKIGIAYVDVPINMDGVRYICAAKAYSLGNFKEGYALFAMPFYPLLIAGVHFLISDWIIAARIISILALIVAIIPMYRITQMLFDRRAAFCASFLFALAPLPNLWSSDIIRGPIFVCCFLWTVYFALISVQTFTLVRFICMTLLAWMSIMMRIEGVVLLPYFVVFLSFIILKDRNKRVPALKGLSIWCGIPLIIFLGVQVTSPKHAHVEPTDQPTFNRIGELPSKMQALFNLEFFQSYKTIYTQLEEMEKKSPLIASGKMNFAEIARHYMPFIYMLGLVELMLKVLFPPFLVALFWARGYEFQRIHLLMLTLFLAYLGMIYLTLIERDFIQQRFLFAPACLIYPWFGLGFKRLTDHVKKCRKPVLAATGVALLFIVAPIWEIGQKLLKEDYAVCHAGKWIAETPLLQRANAFTNDWRVEFYGKKENCTTDNTFDEAFFDGLDAIERAAAEKKADIIIFKASGKAGRKPHDFTSYRLLRSFSGPKRTVHIYGSAAFYAQFTSAP